LRIRREKKIWRKEGNNSRGNGHRLEDSKFHKQKHEEELVYYKSDRALKQAAREVV